MQIIKDSFKRLESSKEFKDFIKENKKAFLCSVFMISEVDSISKALPQFNYFNEGKSATFTVSDKITMEESEYNTKDLKELKLEHIKIGFKEILNKSLEVIKENYKSLNILKVILVLDSEGFEITYLSTALKAVVIKMDHSGNLISHQQNQIVQSVL